MKLTKEKLNFIIAEQMKKYKITEAEDDEASKNKEELRDKFEVLSKHITQVKGLSKSEIVVFDSLLNTALISMQNREATLELKEALQKLQD